MSEKNPPKKFQVQERLKTMISPNDKLTKTITKLPADDYVDIIKTGDKCSIDEKAKGRTKVKSYFRLKLVDGYCDLSPLNSFDRFVLTVCISAQDAGAECVTVDSIFRVMTGSHRNIPRPEQKAAILQSIERLMSVIIEIDSSEPLKKMKYKDLKPRIVSTLLPAEYLDGVEVNGQSTTVIHFLTESPLLSVARAKKQIISYPVELLDVPNQNQTPLVMTIKSYVIQRVHEIIKHKNMEKTLTYEDIFKRCGLADANRRQRQQARKTIDDVMEHLKTEGVIQSFEKVKKGRTYYSITFR